jgi:hypothetical protein
MGWGRTLINLLMNAQVDASVEHAKRLIGDPRFLRINAITAAGLYTLDNAKEIESLIALGNRCGRDPSVLYQVKSRFLNGINAMRWK